MQGGRETCNDKASDPGACKKATFAVLLIGLLCVVLFNTLVRLFLDYVATLAENCCKSVENQSESWTYVHLLLFLENFSYTLFEFF